MSTVLCSRCGRDRTPLGTAPLPGTLGETVASRVCEECWSDWIQTSIRVINHYGLNPSSKEHREKLFEFMREFLKLPAQ